MSLFIFLLECSFNKDNFKSQTSLITHIVSKQRNLKLWTVSSQKLNVTESMSEAAKIKLTLVLFGHF